MAILFPKSRIFEGKTSYLERLPKSSGVFGRLRKSSDIVVPSSKSWHSQDENLTPLSQKNYLTISSQAYPGVHPSGCWEDSTQISCPESFLTEHVKKICVSCHYHLRNISNIRKYLSEDTSEILVHAFISSKLDNCNSLLYGLPKHLLNKLR